MFRAARCPRDGSGAEKATGRGWLMTQELGGIRMVRYFVAPLRRVMQFLLACNTPSELAAGFTLGMIIGFVPKGNLMALSLCVLLFSLRVNKGLALAAAVLFSCVTGWVDPLAHKLGLAVLHADSLQATYASVYNMPFGPWLGFDNTVATGTLLLGLYIAYPVYWSTRAVIARVHTHLQAGATT